MKPSRGQLVSGLKMSLAVFEALRRNYLRNDAEVPGSVAICYDKLVELLVDEEELPNLDKVDLTPLLLWARQEIIRDMGEM